MSFADLFWSEGYAFLFYPGAWRQVLNLNDIRLKYTVRNFLKMRVRKRRQRVYALGFSVLMVLDVALG